jgi:demethylspheroidene O-methyltransferase
MSHEEPPARLRDRWLASRNFQRWAVHFPLTRWIARRRARALFDLCAGFVYSQVLLACVRLDLFEKLRAQPQSLDSLATALDVPRDATRRLLLAATALGLLERRGSDECFGLGIHGAALLGNPGLMPMIEHHALLYEDLRDPVALLRGTPIDLPLIGRFWAYARAQTPAASTDERVRGYTELMSVSQGLIAEQILDAYPLRRHACLLDVGGGDGTFAALAAQRAPRLRILLFDLPAVATRARARFTGSELAGRARAVGGDFMSDPLPGGADVVSLVRVLHDHDDAAVLRILTAVRRVLPPHGTLLIAEPLAGTADGGLVADAYFGFYLLAMGSGCTRTYVQLRTLLRAAGFGAPRVLPTALPAQLRVLVARVSRTSVISS